MSNNEEWMKGFTIHFIRAQPTDGISYFEATGADNISGIRDILKYKQTSDFGRDIKYIYYQIYYTSVTIIPYDKSLFDTNDINVTKELYGFYKEKNYQLIGKSYDNISEIIKNNDEKKNIYKMATFI